MYYTNMDIVRTLVSQRFSLFNLDTEKRPANKRGHKMGCWQRMTYDQLVEQHNYDVPRWGMRMGLHENGRYTLTLDFDCCGKPNGLGERKGCDFTKGKLAEYMTFGIKDGMFSSSTKGNWNVLVDFTDCAPLLERIKKYTKVKHAQGDLEILWGTGCQNAIPPTCSACKLSGKFENPRAFQNDNPLLILTEESPVFQFIMDLLPQEEEAGVKVKVKGGKKEAVVARSLAAANCAASIVANQSLPSDIGELCSEDKFMDLLFNVIGNGVNANGVKQNDWDTWFHIAAILKQSGYNKDVFVAFSVPHATRADALAMWNQCGRTGNFPIYGLQSIAKRVCKEKYNAWRRANPTTTTLTLDTIRKGANDVAKFMGPLMIDELKYSNSTWYAYLPELGVWRAYSRQEPPVSQMITPLQNEIQWARVAKQAEFAAELENTDGKAARAELEERQKEDLKTYDTFYAKTATATFYKAYADFLRHCVHEQDFDKQLDMNKYVIAYKNGVVAFQKDGTYAFRRGLRSTDYITKCLSFNYEPRDEAAVEIVRRLFLRICNNKREHLDYYLSALGYALTGDSAKQQELHYLRGQKASNGKSMPFEALSEIMPEYCIKADSDVFDAGNNTRHKTIHTFRGVRILWVNELTTTKKDAGFFKEVADGTALTYKQMYGNSVSMPICLKPFLIANITIDIDADGGVSRRIRTMQMDSEFLEGLEQEDEERCIFRRDKTLKSRLTGELKHAVLHLLFEYAANYAKTGELAPYPEDWSGENKATIEQNNRFKTWFEATYEAGEEFATTKTSLEAAMRAAGLRTNFADEVKKHKWPYVYKREKMVKGVRGAWLGFRERPVVDEEEETTGVCMLRRP